MRCNLRFLAVLLGGVILLGTPARVQAGHVFLNGVPVAGLRNQKFENCKVVFDAQGNIQITAPGVKIKAVPQPGNVTPPPPMAPRMAPGPPRAPVAPRPITPPPVTMTTTPAAPPPRQVAPPPAPPKKPDPPPPIKTGPLTQRYFLIAIASTKGIAQYDVDVYINKKHARKVRNREGQVTYEVTNMLRWGRNEIQFAATKNMAGQSRQSISASDHVRLVIGPGVKGGGTVKLSEIMADFRAPASKTSNFGATQHIDLK